MSKDEYCVEIYCKINKCNTLSEVINIIILLGYRIVRAVKPYNKKYDLGHISVAHPDHDSYTNPIWISGYKIMNNKTSWIVR